jgi:hypothetical protein
VPLVLFALGLLAALGQLEGETLQVLVALVACIREELGRLGALLFGLASRLRPELGDLALGGRAERGDLALDGRLQFGHLVRGRGTQLLGLAFRVGTQAVGLTAGLHAYLGRFPLAGRADVARLALGAGLHRGCLGAGLVGDLPRLQARGREDALRLAFGVAAVVVGLLLGEAQDLLHASAEAGQRRAAVFLELFARVGELLLDRVEPLLGLAQAALRVVHPLLGLGPGHFGLVDRDAELLEAFVDLVAVITAQNNAELLRRARVVEEGKIGLRLLGHPHILADSPGAFARPWLRSADPEYMVISRDWPRPGRHDAVATRARGSNNPGNG